MYLVQEDKANTKHETLSDHVYNLLPNETVHLPSAKASYVSSTVNQSTLLGTLKLILSKNYTVNGSNLQKKKQMT